ncbi:prepilin-type N-terminal cleavage/methylation domain (plasmid) [Legionella adelaidensis]|uniref:Prepilin-type N-terminal cleavage/methylation domain n=1 Tax=Legionella adelaidensis TaxID=45056 RepID=A0A0W0R0J5_9GAMM|nr:competence type IV pilus minor pilin ComGF [Legionella adelaidensis]KTC64611.1 hypothetical protein Lade_1905 [Legionella adelaidensis]VEH86078.1 prepilin-type N-terminal cleavage/methylation domain [Legionella adelaidensis]
MKMRGFTLIEMVIVIVVTGILSAIVALFLRSGFTGYLAAKPVLPLAINANLALDKIMFELENATSLNAIASDSLTFVNKQNETITISLHGTTVERTVDSNNAQPLLKNVTALTFKYYENNLNVSLSTDSTRLITAQITITDGTATYSKMLSSTVLRRLL